MKHRKCWSKSVGERGARVRLYEDRPGGPLFRSVYVDGKEVRKSPGRPDSEGRDAGQASPGPRRRVGPGDAHDGAQLGDAGAYDDRTAVAAGEPPHRGSR